MPRITAKPFASQPSSSDSGFSIGLGETKAGQFIRISLTEAAGKTLLPAGLKAGKNHLAIALDTDAGKTHLIGIRAVSPDDPDAVPLSAGTRGGVYCKLQCWCQVPKGKLPAKGLPVAGRNSDVVLLKLPDWARPQAEARRT